MAAQNFESTIQDLLGQENLAVHTLSPVNRHFYASEVYELLPLLGSYEHGSPKFDDGLERINSVARLGLNSIQCKALAHVLTVLSDNPRFGSDPNIEKIYGEDPAIHSSHCVLLAIEMFRRAGLCTDSDAVPYRLAICIGALVHDMGEALGEFSSLSQRMENNALEELPEVEREITSIVLHHALYIAENPSGTADFYRSIYRLKHELGVGTDVCIQDVVDAIKRYKAEKLSQLYLSPSAQRSFQSLLRLYDIVELRESSPLTAKDQYIGNAVKVIEHLQGTRHLIRFLSVADNHTKLRLFSTPTFSTEEIHSFAKDEGEKRVLPSHISHSLRIVKGLQYTEVGIGELFEAAFALNEDKYVRLAKHLRNAVYETNIELLSLLVPVVDRQAKGLPDGMKELVADIHSDDVGHKKVSKSRRELIRILEEGHEANIESLQQERRGVSATSARKQLFRYETDLRLTSLYYQAIQSDYIPKPGEVLACLEELPEELSPLELVDWHEVSLGGLPLNRRGYTEGH